MKSFALFFTLLLNITFVGSANAQFSRDEIITHLSESGGVRQCERVFPYPQRNIRWRNGITYFVSREIWDDPILMPRIRSAAAQWRSFGIRIVLRRGSRNLVSPNNGTNEIAFGLAPEPIAALVFPFWGSPNLSDGRCYFEEADILISDKFEFGGAQNVFFPEAFDIGLVMVHEFGHALGLKHDNTQVRSMNSTYPNGGPVSTRNFAMPFGKDIREFRSSHFQANKLIELTASAYRQHPHHYGPTQVSNTRFSPAVAIPIYVLNENRTRATSAVRGQVLRVPFNVSNLSTGRKNVEVKFYLSEDEIIGDRNDLEFGITRLNMDAGTDFFGEKWFTVPRNQRRGTYFVGYRVTPHIGELNPKNNTVKLPLALAIR